jgi:hypothetical protein
MKKTRILVAVAASFLALVGSARAGVPPPMEVFISGKKIVVKDNVDTTKRKVSFVSKDETFNATGLDPTLGGATFYLVDPFPGQQSSTFQMPAGNWSAKNGKYTYADKDLVNGPVKKAKIKNGLVKLVLSGSEIDFPVLGVAPLGEVGGVLTVTNAFDSTTICFLFPGMEGTVKKDSPTKGIYKATNAEAPDFCPAILD